MLLKEICTSDVAFCNPDTTVLAAARIMRQKHVGDLVVIGDPDGDGTPVGIVTDRDIVLEVLGQERDPETVTVRDIMRRPLVIADENEDSSQALARMQTHGVRRVPVVGKQGKLVGIISVDDLFARLAADAGALAEIIAREQGTERRTRR